MSAEEYIQELSVFIDLVRAHRPKRILGNMVDFRFPITPEIQAWVDENLFSVYREIGFEQIAILLSEEFIASLSIEQTMDSAGDNGFQTAFFDNEEAAKRWLLPKKQEVY